MSQAVLTGSHLCKKYSGQAVVNDVSLSLFAGEILGLVGPNGAGKTTTVGMLYGAVTPSAGDITFGDLRISLQGKEARSQMGVVTQEDNLERDFTVYENLIQFAHHYRLCGRAANLRAQELLEQLGLQEFSTKDIDTLSGGLKRRLVLARALINSPKVVFLDEPTTGLDPEARQDFWRYIIELKRSGGSILLTTHYMEEAARLCDRILLIQKGCIVDEGSPSELVTRIAGREVGEVEGISERELALVVNRFGTWHRPFSSGFLFGLVDDSADSLLEELTKFGHSGQSDNFRLTRRRANLEDVFLILTGTTLT